MTKLWFKRKRYGWGWVPSSPEGWAITGSYIVLVILATKLVEQSLDIFLATIGLLIFTLILICIKKGETPKWSWGN